ncbi:MAG: hypothetical protein H8E28_12740 [Anaerolineae bacterium]|nr:hypothetical protein [Anaerolineae bacterium]
MKPFDRALMARLLVTFAVLLLLIWAGSDFYAVVEGTQNWIGKFTLTWGLPLAGMILFGVLAIVLGLMNLWLPEKTEQLVVTLARTRDQLGHLRWLIFAALALLPAKIFLYTPIGFKLTGAAFRLAFLIAVGLAMAVFATRHPRHLICWRPLGLSFVAVGAVIVFAAEFVTVVDYPLSLTWSEGNRIWDYSWLYGRRFYNYPLTQRFEAYIDIGRQSLWGLPFLLDGVTLEGVRLWSALVFTVPYLFLGWVALRALPGRRKDWFWVGVWLFLFLYQGPIYTPLVLSAILVAGARRKPLWIALPLIYLAGYYAQLSRLTWMIAPAVWAVTMALLDDETPPGERMPWRSWLQVGLYGLAGLFGGVGIQRGWARISRQLGLANAAQGGLPVNLPTSTPAAIFTDTADAVEAVSSGANSFLTDQPLLWERLWPNPTNGLGIVLELMLAALPLIILLVYLMVWSEKRNANDANARISRIKSKENSRRSPIRVIRVEKKSRNWRLNIWQKLAVAGGLLGFLGIGLIISVKIGGGSNLHNLDMFLVGLIFVAAAAWEHGGGQILANLQEQASGVKLLFLFLALIPAFLPIMDAMPLELPEQQYVEHTIDLLITESEHVVAQGGEVLFMDQRQLIAFGVVDIPMVPEYEKKQVMDRALAQDMEYLMPFYRDLAEQRFGLIITDPQRIRYSREEEQWDAENDAWVQWVTEPLYCYYEPKYSKDKTHVWFFVPREEIGDCSYYP